MQHPRSGGGKSSKTSSVTSASAPTNTLRFDFHRSYRTVSHARTASSLATATAPPRCCCVIGLILRHGRVRDPLGTRRRFRQAKRQLVPVEGVFEDLCRRERTGVSCLLQS